MYFTGSYGHQSTQISPPTDELDISTHSSFSSASSPTCAFPSWPRRSSLNQTNDSRCSNPFEQHSGSFITDEELFSTAIQEHTYTPTFSFPSHSPASLSQCRLSAEPQPPQCQVAHNSARDLVRELVELEKAKRAMKRRKNSSASRKSRTTSSGSKPMSPIIE